MSVGSGRQRRDGRRSPASVGQTIDRVAHRRRDPEWLAEAWRHGQVVVVDDHGRALVTGDPPRLVLTAPEEAPPGERLFLGVDGEQAPYFAVAGALPAASGAEPATLRRVGALLQARDADLFSVAAGLVRWHSRYSFSPVTGAPTRTDDAGWTRRAEEGETLVFPRTDPAVIVLITDGGSGDAGRALLGRGVGWASEQFSCLAGFVEPGESAESTVVREVREEVGLAVRDVRYVTSQPWPFPGTLMLAFTALADPSQALRPDPAELAEARWLTRPQLRELWERRNPVRSSVAYYLLSSWLYRD